MERKCYNHPSVDAVDLCCYCNRPLCSRCISLGRTNHCTNSDDCLEYQSKNPLPPPTDVSNKPTPDSEQKLERVPVRGWLLLLCISLTILRPVLFVLVWNSAYDELYTKAIYRYNGSRGGTHYFHPYTYFDIYPQQESLFATWFAIDLLMTVFSVFAGVLLWRGKPKALVLAKLYLITNLGASILIESLPRWLGVSLPPEIQGPMTRQTIYLAISVVVWYLYLKRSMRVIAIYGTGPSLWTFVTQDMFKKKNIQQ